MATNKVRKPFSVIRKGSVKVSVYKRDQVKNGRLYTGYLVPDHSTRRRKLWHFADPELAKEKANEIADALATGKTEILQWEDTLRVELRSALQAIEPTGIRILNAAQIFAEACKLVGPDQILSACQYWLSHGPTRPLTPKPTKDAVDDFLGRQKVGERRKRVLSTYLKRFGEHFKAQRLHEIEAAQISDFVDGQGWAPKTRNDALCVFSLIFREGQLRNWVPPGHNPPKEIKRSKVIGGAIEVFEPSEAKQMLNRIGAELVPFLALWLFAGIRKEEISRMNWQQVNRGLETGWIVLEAKQTKTGQTRSVPIADNLKAWLTLHRKLAGDILSKRWQSMTQLDDLTKYISRKTGIVWKNNAPRHSYGSYSFKLNKDAGAVVAAMGNSLSKFQKHYWNRSNAVTEETAKEWFSIVPEESGKIVPLAMAIDDSPDQLRHLTPTKMYTRP